jgi:hypothetical protein
MISLRLIFRDYPFVHNSRQKRLAWYREKKWFLPDLLLVIGLSWSLDPGSRTGTLCLGLSGSLGILRELSPG